MSPVSLTVTVEAHTNTFPTIVVLILTAPDVKINASP